MPFSFGGSKSKSKSESQSTSESQEQSQSGSFGIGGSISGSESSSSIAFEDIFAQLFGGATGAAAGIDTSAITGAANMLFTSGAGFLENLGGGGAGAQFLEAELGRSDDLVSGQIDQLSADIGEFLNETVMPGITSGGVSARTLGGSRGEVSKGLAGEAALEEFTRGSLDIRQRERDRITGIAGTLASNELSRNQAGLAALPGLMGLAEGGAMADLSPFMALSQILGGPTVLTDSSSFGSSFDESGSFSESSGSSSSQSSSKSKGKSKSGSFGFG